MPSFLTVAALGSSSLFACQLDPIRVPRGVPPGKRLAPATQEMLPTCATRAGEVRSDGTVMTSWGGDARVVYQASRESAPQGYVHVGNRFISRVKVPRLLVIGWMHGHGLAQPQQLFIHSDDLAVASEGTGIAPIQLRKTTRLDGIGRLIAASRVRAASAEFDKYGQITEVTFRAAEPGLTAEEWASLGFYSPYRSQPSTTCAETGASGDGLPIPADEADWKDSGIQPEQPVHYHPQMGLTADTVTIHDPEKAARWFKVPEFASLPRDTKLSRMFYRQCWEIPLGLIPQFFFLPTGITMPVHLTEKLWCPFAFPGQAAFNGSAPVEIAPGKLLCTEKQRRDLMVSGYDAKKLYWEIPETTPRYEVPNESWKFYKRADLEGLTPYAEGSATAAKTRAARRKEVKKELPGLPGGLRLEDFDEKAIAAYVAFEKARREGLAEYLDEAAIRLAGECHLNFGGGEGSPIYCGQRCLEKALPGGTVPVINKKGLNVRIAAGDFLMEHAAAYLRKEEPEAFAFALELVTNEDLSTTFAKAVLTGDEPSQ